MVKLTLCRYKHSIFEDGWEKLSFEEQHELVEYTCGFYDNIIDAYEDVTMYPNYSVERLMERYNEHHSIFVEIYHSTAWYSIDPVPGGYRNKKLIKSHKDLDPEYTQWLKKKNR